MEYKKLKIGSIVQENYLYWSEWEVEKYGYLFKKLGVVIGITDDERYVVNFGGTVTGYHINYLKIICE